MTKTTFTMLGIFMLSLCAIFAYSNNTESLRLCKEAGYTKEQCILIMR